MTFPVELAEKTKKIFPKEKELHRVVAAGDAASVLGYLNEMLKPITDIANEWTLVKMRDASGADENLGAAAFSGPNERLRVA